ncbi:MAG TPA: glycoside hydrolase family 27 protein, partial [Polyangiaceae bacterium]|nr:glycoside hydrolase family 27 protein [Polyangiaceae bacterium]
MKTVRLGSFTIFLAIGFGCSSNESPGAGTGGRGGDASTSGGGSAVTGGTTASGGFTVTGGTIASGGSAVTGGTTASGGSTVTGGTTASGGSTVTGGTTASGGSVAMGGTSGASGGGGKAAGSGGSAGASKGGSSASGGVSGGSSGGGGSSATGGQAGAGRGGAGGNGGAGGTGGGSAGTSSGPPMGWASWNSFAAKIDYNVIKGQADAMVSSGLKAAGYQYVNIDEGWWQGKRDGSGNFTIDTAEWPGGMQAIADYIHGLGLKAGIYTDAGKDGCGYYYPTGRPAAPGSGSEGHYEQDFLQFSKWGFDFVKVDWCGGKMEGLDAKTAYQAISDAIKKATAQTGRPMVLSVCNWGEQSPWNWAPSLSTMWRTSQDIIYYGEAPAM